MLILFTPLAMAEGPLRLDVRYVDQAAQCQIVSVFVAGAGETDDVSLVPRPKDGDCDAVAKAMYQTSKLDPRREVYRAYLVDRLTVSPSKEQKDCAARQTAEVRSALSDKSVAAVNKRMLPQKSIGCRAGKMIGQECGQGEIKISVLTATVGEGKASASYSRDAADDDFPVLTVNAAVDRDGCKIVSAKDVVAAIVAKPKDEASSRPSTGGTTDAAAH